MPRLSKIGAAALAAFGWTSGSAVSASYLVVAGGGGGATSLGGSYNGGAGGAGGLLTGTASLNPTLSYTVTIGSGGAISTNGSDSAFSTITSTGGGKGGAGASNPTGIGANGGSGGGGAAGGAYGGAGGSGNTPSTSPSQGNNGGTGSGTTGNGTGGGGGAGAVGANASGTVGGNGGAGTASSISGSSVTYAGGGGGGVNTGGTPGTGGSGGGGNGATTGAAGSGTANTGGGGGSANSSGTAGAGGSGVVIISYVGAQQFGGGSVTSSGGNTIHTFTTSGTLSPLSSLTAQYLVVAGGGGGGRFGGGGGAGGLLTGTGVTIDTNSNYVVTVGAGGAGSTSGSFTAGVSGGNSSWGIVATAAVGGGAGTGTGNGVTGGSGGGVCYQGSGAAATGGSATSGQGNVGGNALTNVNGTSGGGGAGAAGSSVTTANGGNGGNGSASSISGASVTYAGGGGGACDALVGGSTNGTGGTGGGGNGNNTSAGADGTANLGGGGGGGGRTSGSVIQNGGNGGSGVVIISYPGSTQQMAGGTVTISGGNVIHTFTSSGYLTPIKYASRSLRFRSSASAYLSKTPTVSGNTTTFTYSVWAKRGSLSSNQYLFWGGNNCNFGFGVVGTDELGGNLRGTGATNYFFNTIGVFRDPSAWYHIVWAVDTTQATDTNRLKIYVNGVQQTLSVTYPPQNTVQLSTAQRNIGSESGRYYYDGYMAEANFIDGAALTPSSFGTFNSYGVWQPITYGGSYGTNGFYLTFGNNTSTTTLGYDTSPQGNNWTTNNISLTAGATYDSMLDVPTLTSATVANYATLNPLSKTGQTISNGNLTFSSSAGTSGQAAAPTFAVGSSGKWYWEVQITTTPQNQTEECIGVVNDIGTPATLQRAYNSAGQYFDGTSWVAYGSAWAINDVIGIAIDVTNSQITFYKNNTSQGVKTFAWNANGNCTLRLGSTTGTTYQANFGQRPFTYSAPTGFVALNTYNLSTPTIPNGAVYMAATTYTGTGATQVVTNTVNGTAMQPDWVWFKRRNTAENHWLVDVIRGVSNGLYSNLTNAEASQPTTVSSFNSNGFTVGADTTGFTNVNGNTYVAWQWKANGAGVSNTSGSITSTVSANTTAGFSVVTYTGTGANATVGHGLGVAPSMIIEKVRTVSTGWCVYHVSLGATKLMELNTTGTPFTSSTYWQNTDPTSSVFSISTYGGVNTNGGTHVAYCFAAIAGYSAFGSYTGNGSSDGPFVYLGFRPRWLLIKRTDSTGDWRIYDSSRTPANPDDNVLEANTSDAEDTASGVIDILSNGFKLRDSGANNISAGTYIYMAFAENPFKYANAR